MARRGDGKVIKEPSKELQLIVPGEAEKDIKEKIDAIVAVYKQRVQQQAVGIVTRRLRLFLNVSPIILVTGGLQHRSTGHSSGIQEVRIIRIQA